MTIKLTYTFSNNWVNLIGLQYASSDKTMLRLTYSELPKETMFSIWQEQASTDYNKIHLIKYDSSDVNPCMPSGLFDLNLAPVHFNIRTVWLAFIVMMFYRNSCLKCKQCWTLISRRDIRHLTWIYTVCRCPYYGTLGTNSYYRFKAWYRS